MQCQGFVCTSADKVPTVLVTFHTFSNSVSKGRVHSHRFRTGQNLALGSGTHDNTVTSCSVLLNLTFTAGSGHQDTTSSDYKSNPHIQNMRHRIY
jgi:hypothetical protein